MHRRVAQRHRATAQRRLRPVITPTRHQCLAVAGASLTVPISASLRYGGISVSGLILAQSRVRSAFAYSMLSSIGYVVNALAALVFLFGEALTGGRGLGIGHHRRLFHCETEWHAPRHCAFSSRKGEGETFPICLLAADAGRGSSPAWSKCCLATTGPQAEAALSDGWPAACVLNSATAALESPRKGIGPATK